MPAAIGALDQRPPAIFLLGPTAAGKTALACQLADRFPLALVSVDSALIYRGLDIGSAKPSAMTQRRYPHALLDIRDLAEPYSAAAFREDALVAMRAATERGQIPLLVGGTGLYFRALQYGLSPMPSADPMVRQRLQAEAAQSGWPALYARFAAKDPAAAARVRPNDAQRIQRALEVMELSGSTLTCLRATPAPGAGLPWRLLKLALVPRDREVLRARIAARLDAMLAAGLVAEVQSLRARSDLSPQLPALRAVGYRQAWQYLDGQFDRATLRLRILHATRQLAKRQLTWLRGELDARALDPDGANITAVLARAVAAFLRV